MIILIMNINVKTTIVVLVKASQEDNPDKIVYFL